MRPTGTKIWEMSVNLPAFLGLSHLEHLTYGILVTFIVVVRFRRVFNEPEPTSTSLCIVQAVQAVLFLVTPLQRFLAAFDGSSCKGGASPVVASGTCPKIISCEIR